MSRNQTLIRVLKLWRRLDGLHYLPPVDELARDFGVHERTIYRDLAALQEAHLPVPPRADMKECH